MLCIIDPFNHIFNEPLCLIQVGGSHDVKEAREQQKVSSQSQKKQSVNVFPQSTMHNGGRRNDCFIKDGVMNDEMGGRSELLCTGANAEKRSNA